MQISLREKIRKEIPLQSSSIEDPSGISKKQGEDSYPEKYEFLDTVLKREWISYSFLQRYTLIQGYKSDSEIGAAIRQDSSNKILSGIALNHFEGDSVHSLNKRFVMAVVSYEEEGVCDYTLLFIIDVVTNKNTDWIVAAHGCDSDDGINDDVSFELKNDSVLVIMEHVENIDINGNSTEVRKDRRKYVLHINNEGKFIGKRPE